MQDLVAGQIDIMFDQAANSLPQVRNGNVKAYRRHREVAIVVGARHPDRGRGGNAGLLHLGVACPLGAEGHAEGHRLQAHRRGRGGTGRSRRADAGSTTSGRRLPPPDQQTPEALSRITRPRSRSGGRSSRPRTSRPSNLRRAICGRRRPKPNPRLNYRCAAGHPGLGLPYESHRLQAFRSERFPVGGYGNVPRHCTPCACADGGFGRDIDAGHVPWRRRQSIADQGSKGTAGQASKGVAGQGNKGVAARAALAASARKMPKHSPILVRFFKEEAELEVWKQDTTGRFQFLKVYPICRWSGDVGPKLYEGDRQAPEGFYTVTPER